MLAVRLTFKDPILFEGLDVRWVRAEGASQSAARLQTYINAVQPVERVIDGFLLAVHGGQVCPLASDRTVGRPRDVTDQSANVDQSGLPSIAGLHEGADTRVFVVNSESETLSFPSRAASRRRSLSLLGNRRQGAYRRHLCQSGVEWFL